jgi:pyruvate/2-oxoglutarate dehydrogenase complex dihydrolipoamide acyltransferase (E2) component
VKQKQGYQVVPFSVQRQAVAASATVGRERNNIHTFTEVDITMPRRFIHEHHEHTGDRLSLTAYVVASLARTITEYPTFNAFRKGRKLVLLDDVTVGVLVERIIAGEGVPEILTIHAADTKTYRQINDEIRTAQQQGDAPFGSLSGSTWIMRLIPGFLLTQFIRLAARNIGIARRYGVVGVTAVGMFGPSPMWIVPLSGATVAIAVGSIVERPVCIDGALTAREHLCLTLSFDHDIIDGAPAARFTQRFAAMLASGELLHEAGGPQSTNCRE